MLTVQHSGTCGDVLYSLASVKALGQPVRFLIKANVGGLMLPSHPCGKVRITTAYAEKLLPLLRAQPYIAEAGIWNGEEVDIDLDAFRESGFDLAMGDIARWYAYCFLVNPDLANPWLTAPASPETGAWMRETAGLCLINRTARYVNKAIDYSFLVDLPDVAFVGLASEMTAFRQAFKARIPHFIARDYLQLASWIAGCRLFIGNQSSCFALAQGLQVTRMLEVYPFAPNVIIHGLNGWDYINQGMCEKIFWHLWSNK